MKKPTLHGFTREIIAVSFDENGNRIERDWDLIPEEEKQEIRQRTSARMFQAAGYVPAGKEQAAALANGYEVEFTDLPPKSGTA